MKIKCLSFLSPGAGVRGTKGVAATVQGTVAGTAARAGASASANAVAKTAAASSRRDLSGTRASADGCWRRVGRALPPRDDAAGRNAVRKRRRRVAGPQQAHRVRGEDQRGPRFLVE